MDLKRVRAELERLVDMTELVEHEAVNENGVDTWYVGPRAVRDEIIPVAHVAEQILDQVLPRWRTGLPKDGKEQWQQHREAAQRALTQLERDVEVREMLGDDSPTLSAGTFHPWAWDGARSMWSTGHFGQGVVDALKRVNAEAQNKSGRRDVAETKLFQQLFTTDAPRPGAPRLRLMDDDGSDTYKSVHRGPAALAEGLFAGVRNPSAHTVALGEVDEQHALEQLAAVSVLARWVETATVVTT